MIDIILVEIIQNALLMVAEEAGMRATRSAGSPFVRQASTVASALFDGEGRLIAQSSAGPTHRAALRAMVPEVMKDFPPEKLQDGDIMLSNSQFRGGIHPTDVGAFRPIFHEGKIAFWAAVMMVTSDLGGISSGSIPATGTEIFHEGLVLPPTKFYEAGTLNDSLMRVIVGNSRTPGRIRSDVEALAAAVHVAAQRTGDVVAKHGHAKILEAIEVMLDTTERMTRASIAKIPDGVYTGSYMTEDDGIDIGKNYEIHVKITITDDECEVDFTGTSAQARGAINSSLSQSMSFVTHALRCYFENDIRENAGFYRPIEMILPKGTLVNPNYPAATNIRFATGQSMCDAMFNALRPIFPDRSWAPSASTATINAFGRSRSGELWSAFDVIFGASGARANGDAIEGFPWPMMGQAGYMRNVEIYEMLFPALYHSYRLEPDSAGAGRWRGASSVVKEVEFLEDGELTTRGNDRFKLAPLGVEGGLPAMVGRLMLNEGTDRERVLPPKSMNIPIKAGDVLIIYAPGGGGYGPPEQREPERVLTDVRRGYVSREAARDIYKVEITADGRAVDEKLTAELRKDIAP